MKIRIRAEIIIEYDMQTQNTEPSVQTDLGSFAGRRPSRASKPVEAVKVVYLPSKPANGPKQRRSDYGGNHHCSKCGNAGTKATERLGGFCKVCHPHKGYSGWA